MTSGGSVGAPSAFSRAMTLNACVFCVERDGEHGDDRLAGHRVLELRPQLLERGALDDDDGNRGVARRSLRLQRWQRRLGRRLGGDGPVDDDDGEGSFLARGEGLRAQISQTALLLWGVERRAVGHEAPNDDDLPLHVEALVVVERLAQAIPGEHERALHLALR